MLFTAKYRPIGKYSVCLASLQTYIIGIMCSTLPSGNIVMWQRKGWVGSSTDPPSAVRKAAMPGPPAALSCARPCSQCTAVM